MSNFSTGKTVFSEVDERITPTNTIFTSTMFLDSNYRRKKKKKLKPNIGFKTNFNWGKKKYKNILEKYNNSMVK